MKEIDPPFKDFGLRIKFLREQWQQTITEVAITLEMDEKTLKAIEEGKSLPNIDQLDMIINHFLLNEDQADDLRELADSNQNLPDPAQLSNFDESAIKQIMMLLPSDNKVLYTDSMNATVTDNGVVLHFMQTVPSGPPVHVSKLGMSHSHAQKIIEVLTQTMKQHEINKDNLTET